MGLLFGASLFTLAELLELVIIIAADAVRGLYSKPTQNVHAHSEHQEAKDKGNTTSSPI